MQESVDLGALRDIILLSNDVYKMRAAALPYVLACLQARDEASVLSLLPLLTYNEPVLSAIEAASTKVELWPLFEGMLTAPSPKRDDLASSLGRYLKKHAGSPEYAIKMARVATLSPDCAVRLGEIIAREDSAQLIQIADTLVELALSKDEPIASRARRALRMGGQQGAIFGDALLPLVSVRVASTELVTIIAREQINALTPEELMVVLARDLEDSRPELRLGVVDALRSVARKRAGLWSLFLNAGNDADPAIRKVVFETAQARAEQHEQWLPSDESVRDLLNGATPSSTHEVLAYLAHVAARAPKLAAGWLAFFDGLSSAAPLGALRSAIARLSEQRPTRACEQCRDLRQGDTWNHALSEPKQFAALQSPLDSSGKTDGLRRCDACSAYFSYSYDCEYDVNSQHETMTLVRHTQKEMLALYPGRIDTSHPRWAQWQEALIEDLEHIDGAVRKAAAWELGKDACKEKAFARLEETLLHHPAAEVIEEGLLALVAACGIERCPIGRETFVALSRHDAPKVQQWAAFLLVVHDALDRSKPLEWVFDEGPTCEGQATAVSRLLGAGMTLSAKGAAALLHSALRVKKPSIYALHHLVRDTLFAGPFVQACSETILSALSSEEQTIRDHAWELARHLPPALIGNTAALARVLAAQPVAPGQVMVLSADMVTAGAPIAPVAGLFARALASKDRYESQRVVPAIQVALKRGEVCAELFIPLCDFCDRVRDAYEAMGLIRQWTAAHAVPAAGLPTLLRVVETGTGSFHDDSVHAVTSMLLRANDQAAVLSLLEHKRHDVRGVAASHLAALKAIVSAEIHARLTWMASSDESYPRGEARRALDVVTLG